MRRTAAVLCMLAWMAPQAESEAADKYHVTDQEKAACTEDAVRLCISTYPNEDLLIQCMTRNRAALSPTCLSAFDAGVKRRHLKANSAG